MEELDEGTIQLLKENKEQRELREIIENIKYGEENGSSVFDFDETAGISDNVVIATKGKKTRKIASSEWPVVGETLIKEALGLLGDENEQKILANNIKKLAKPQAAADIATTVFKIAGFE